MQYFSDLQFVNITVIIIIIIIIKMYYNDMWIKLSVHQIAIH
jgi:hypothetical protein